MGEELRKALEDAVDKDDDDITPTPPAEDPPVEDPPTEDPPAEDPPAEDPPAGDPPPEDPPAEDPPAEDPPPPEDKLDKAPVNWSAGARESWKDLPDAVKAQVQKREIEMNKALQGGSQSRKSGEAFDKLSDRYASVIAAEGIQSPLEGYERVLQTMSTMRMGSPQQKASQIAAFITAYNVDIGMLDDMLVGKTGEPNGPNAHLSKLIDERMAPVNQLLDRVNQAEAQRTDTVAADAKKGVDVFSTTAEFIEDVRMDMADLMDLAANRNEVLTLKQAYDKACMMNPEVAKIIQTRNTSNSIEAKRKAAASIKGRKSGAGGGKGDLSMRAQIAELYDQAEAGG